VAQRKILKGFIKEVQIDKSMMHWIEVLILDDVMYYYYCT
jgi:hypothetical protein